MINNFEISKENNFNLFRLFLAIFVIFSHSVELRDGNRDNEFLSMIFETLTLGEVAVDCFFILSGFLIAKSWLDKPKVIPFLLNRIFRIYPAFIVTCIICSFLISPFYSQVKNYSDFLNSFNFSDYIFNLLQLKLNSYVVDFPNTNYPVLNQSLWTISYEFKCYMSILILGLLFKNNKYLWLFIFLFLSCFYFYINFDSADVRAFLFFSTGVVYYQFKNIIPWKKEISIFALLGVFLSMSSIYFVEYGLVFFGSYFIFYHSIFNTKLFRFNNIPDISYGIYLYAWPINKIVLWHFPHMNTFCLITVNLFISIILGFFSHYFIEKPFLKIKTKLIKT